MTHREERQPQEAAKSVQKAWSEFKSSLHSCLPEDFWKHERAARRELLLAARSLLDVAIDHLEEKESLQEKRAKRIEIE